MSIVEGRCDGDRVIHPGSKEEEEWCIGLMAKTGSRGDLFLDRSKIGTKEVGKIRLGPGKYQFIWRMATVELASF